jgi:hypothetical protein
MKQTAAFILLLVYLIASTGATLHSHYCMGSISDYSVYGDVETACGKCGMPKADTDDKGCCKDEVRWVKLQNDQKANNFSIEFTKVQLAEIQTGFIQQPTIISNDHRVFEKCSSLRSPTLPSYLLHCVFRI